MDLNLVVLLGRLVTTPEHRVFDTGDHLLRMLVAINTTYPRRRLDIVPVTLWDPPEEYCDGSLQPDTRLWIVGSVQRRYWEGVEGRRSRLEIVAGRVLVRDDADEEPVGSLAP